MDIDNKILTIDNKKYLVIESIELENKKYVYLVNKVDSFDTMFKEIRNENGLNLYEIEENLFKEKLYPLFLEKFKNY